MKKATLLFLLVLSSAISFCQNFTKEWVSDSLFLKPESALLTLQNKLFISRILTANTLQKMEMGLFPQSKQMVR